MENIGPILFVIFAILYLIGCVVFAFILWLIYKFVIKVEEKPSFGALYKVSFSSGLIAGVLGYVLFRIAAATAILGAGPGGGTDAAALAVLMQILSYPLTMAALYIIVGLSISSLLFYAGLYLAHRYHAKSTPKNIASKASLVFVAVLFLMQGAFFTYAWIAASRGMEAAYGDLSPEEAAAVDAARNPSPEQAAAAQAARRCATQMQQALNLPPEEQEAAMREAANCMAEAGNTLASASPPSSDPVNVSNAVSPAMGESEPNVSLMPSGASTTSSWCGVYDNSTDTYLNLRAAPSPQYRIVGRVTKADLLRVDTAQCRDDFLDGANEFGLSVCAKNPRWVFVENVSRSGVDANIKGWANSNFIRQVTCPEDG